MEKWLLFKKKKRRREKKRGRDDLKACRREGRAALRGHRALCEHSSAAPAVSLAGSLVFVRFLRLCRLMLLPWSLCFPTLGHVTRVRLEV